MTSINDETNGKYQLSFYGAQFALGLRGDKEFIRKACNFLYNNSITNGKLHWFYEEFAYILIESKDKLLNGLINQFRSEIILSKEVPYKKEVWDDEAEANWIEYDDEAIDKLAKEKAAKFMNDKITIDNFMLNMGKFSSPIYQMGTVEQSAAE